jgi:hypothetical protein
MLAFDTLYASSAVCDCSPNGAFWIGVRGASAAEIQSDAEYAVLDIDRIAVGRREWQRRSDWVAADGSIEQVEDHVGVAILRRAVLLEHALVGERGALRRLRQDSRCEQEKYR